MAMTLCPQTASNVLNLSYRYGCNYKRSRCPDGGVAAGWAHLKGPWGWGSCHTGSQMCSALLGCTTELLLSEKALKAGPASGMMDEVSTGERSAGSVLST